MKSEERHVARYERRRQIREQKRQKFLTNLPSYDELFSYENLYESFYKCRVGVRWKESIQRYELNLPVNIEKLYDALMRRDYKSPGFHEFIINERGKQRHIRSVHISERVVQKTLCDGYLVPLLEHNPIYDNSATIKGKGTDFALDRMKIHLRNYYLDTGTNVGYILIFDFSDYFGSIDHDILHEQLMRNVTDHDIRNIIFYLVSNFGTIGLGLGSQVSQILSVAFPNEIDHLLKDHYGIKYYGRYMDDGYIICNSMKEAMYYKEVLFDACKGHRINISDRKVHIERIDKGFQYLKKDTILTETGKVVMALRNESFKIERDRLRNLRTLLDRGIVTTDNVIQGYKSWRGWANRYDNRRSIYHTDKLYFTLFPEISKRDIFAPKPRRIYTIDNGQPSKINWEAHQQRMKEDR